MKYIERFITLIKFCLFYFSELMQANTSIFLDIIGIKQKGKPAVFEFPTRCDTDLEYFILTNLITFTPGTICIESDPEIKIIKIHDMFHSDTEATCSLLKNKYEAQLLYIIRGKKL